jgi:hypothetical protein
MLPYSATDVLHVMQHAMQHEDERRLGPHLARDVRRDGDGDTVNDRISGKRLHLWPSFLLGFVLARGA